MKAIFFSDAHILYNERERAGRLAGFIRDVSRDADIVVILGDLFEFYHGHDGYIYPFYRNIVDALKEIAQTRGSISSKAITNSRWDNFFSPTRESLR